MSSSAEPFNRRFTRSSLSRAGLLALVIMAIAPVVSSPAQAGLLDFLFGRREPPPQRYYAPPPRYYDPLAVATGKRLIKPAHRVKIHARSRTKVAAGRVAPPTTLAGPLGHFLLDPTLRRGDVVVTSDGLKIFTGAAGARHLDSDFAALAEAGKYAAGNASALTSIDRANRLSRPAPEGALIIHGGRPTPDQPPGAGQSEQRAAYDGNLMP